MPTRDPYCDKAYWDFSQRALREIDVEIDPYAVRTSQEVVDKLPFRGQALLPRGAWRARQGDGRPR